MNSFVTIVVITIVITGVLGTMDADVRTPATPAVTHVVMRSD